MITQSQKYTQLHRQYKWSSVFQYSHFPCTPELHITHHSCCTQQRKSNDFISSAQNEGMDTPEASADPVPKAEHILTLDACAHAIAHACVGKEKRVQAVSSAFSSRHQPRGVTNQMQRLCRDWRSLRSYAAPPEENTVFDFWSTDICL